MMNQRICLAGREFGEKAPGNVMCVDPSSQFFCTRFKAIRFVLWIGGRFIPLPQDFFTQHAGYNDFSGGYSRSYNLIPDWLVEHKGVQDLLRRFVHEAKLPERSILFMNIQTSLLSLNEEVSDSRRIVHDVTGQGIHTDGSDSGLLMVLSRENVVGADSGIYKDLAGQDQIMKETLQPGEVYVWRDNEIFHSVGDMFLEDDAKGYGERSVLVVLGDSEFFLTGQRNPQNNLGRNDMPVQIRKIEAEQTQIKG